ncbi:alpha/beta hydrolase [Comamonas testosteroni]
MYQPQRHAASRQLVIRNHPYHLLQWGGSQTRPPLVLCHGWMDVGASFQFVVDQFNDTFTESRTIIAPDWRGFGQSRNSSAPDHFPFVDYLGDLDTLIDEISPHTPIDLLGHSMGGNVAMLYAAARPARVRRLINLEGFGLPASQPAQAPQRTARWLDEIRDLRHGKIGTRPYADAAEVSARLQKNNPRLSADKALWLAHHWATEGADGQWRIAGDDAHKVVSAQLFRADEMLASYAAITCPTLMVKAEPDTMAAFWQGRFTQTEFLQRLALVPDVRVASLTEAGHMLHHDQPHALASLIEDFLGN